MENLTLSLAPWATISAVLVVPHIVALGLTLIASIAKDLSK